MHSKFWWTIISDEWYLKPLLVFTYLSTLEAFKYRIWMGNFQSFCFQKAFQRQFKNGKRCRNFEVQSYALTLTGPFICRCWPSHYCRVNSRSTTIVEVMFISKLTENCFFLSSSYCPFSYQGVWWWGVQVCWVLGSS